MQAIHISLLMVRLDKACLILKSDLNVWAHYQTNMGHSNSSYILLGAAVVKALAIRTI